MKEYKTYIPVALIILMFLSLIIFHKDIATYISQSKIEQLSANTKKVSATRLPKNTTIIITGKLTITRSLNLAPQAVTPAAKWKKSWRK